VLLHTGDFTYQGLPEEIISFNKWLGELPYKYKVVIAGNHELTFDEEHEE
jgi:3',5'-cyclic AMP phosphodiesterase CpdA